MSAANALPAATLAADFETSYADLVRYLSHQASPGDQGRDLAHDMWLRLADSTALKPLNARAYLFGAARHLAIDHARRDRHHAELLADNALRQTTHAPDVAERVGHRQALEAVQRALQALPERTREAFLAHRLDGIGHDELAQAHGVTRSTIERDIQRAQGQVQAAMERWHGAVPAAGRRRSLAALLGFAGTAVAAPFAWLAWRGWQDGVPQWQQAHATPVGRIDRLKLPDGTRLTLDAGSAFELAFYRDRRELKLLRGTAFFEVAHDTERPFGVHAGGSIVTVLGTRFEVELRETAVEPAARPTVRVAVESGRVRVQSPSGQALLLGAGDVLQVDAAGVASHDTQAAGALVAPWRDGWLSFRQTPLAEAAERIGRYRAQPVRVSAAVAALSVSGEVRIAQADEWLHLLPRLMPVQVHAAPDGSLVIQPR